MRVQVVIDGVRYSPSASFKPGDAWTWKDSDHGISIGVLKTGESHPGPNYVEGAEDICRVRIQHGAAVRMINHRVETKGVDYWAMSIGGTPFAQYDYSSNSAYATTTDFETTGDRDATHFVSSSNPPPGYYVHNVWEATVVVFFERVTFHVYYHANGRGAVVPQPTPFKITGSRVTLDYNASRLFHDFLGYDTSPTATSPRYTPPMTYYPGSDARDLHLYAIWSPAFTYLPVRNGDGELLRGAVNALPLRHGDEGS